MKICDREGPARSVGKLAIARQNMKCFGAKSGLKKGLGYGSERGYN